MKYKKLIIFFMTIIFAFSVYGCSSSESVEVDYSKKYDLGKRFKYFRFRIPSGYTFNPGNVEIKEKKIVFVELKSPQGFNAEIQNEVTGDKIVLEKKTRETVGEYYELPKGKYFVTIISGPYAGRFLLSFFDVVPKGGTENEKESE